MKSQELYSEINLILNDYDTLMYQENTFSEPEKLLNSIKENLQHLIPILFKTGKKENFYWDNCTFLTYKKYYKKRLKDFLNEYDNENYNELDFIKREKKLIKGYSKVFYLHYLDYETQNIIRKSCTKKITFLEEKQFKLTVGSQELLDLSEDNVAVKVLYFHELGLLNYLRTKTPFNTSINSLAIALSGLTGAKTTTLQSYLNPLLNLEVDSKNNPLNNKKNLLRIRKRLSELGFDLH
ncbi:hypothetical protein V1389_06475 [Flavobacterium rakeshii]|uniref:hypothetical protein n=1 Tax=Flavobacterium rakeshii TaxID=1038845 RepID=UPI002E7AF843|nr:hypothetical protein [Flavobacterium rakeshii]MEE1897971.1 hypothetical protein [Flavobacterium rakeshii]